MAEPKYRFKRNDGSSYPAWKEMPLGTLVSENLDPVPTPREGYRRVGIYCHAKGTFQEDVPAENVLDVDTMYRIHKDNLIVNITFAWEHAVAIVKPEDEGLLVSHRFPEYSFNAGQVPGFYKYLVLRPYFRNQLSLASPGGAGRNRVLNKAQFKKIPVSVPCEEEQQKIADFLSSVDDVISTSEQEVENLEMQKKAVMKKIFSQEARFKRADGSDFPEWEEQSFENAFEPLNNNTFSRDMLNYDFGPALNIHYGDILVKYEDVCDIQTEGLPYVNEGINVSKYAHLQDGDIILADTAEDEAVGKAVEIINVGNSIVVSGLHTMVCRPKQKYSPKYLGYYMNSPAFHDQLKPYMQGIKVTSIGRKNIKDISVMYPSDLEEQRLIADFLSDFDEAIAAAKKELNLWKELMKGLLQQMFI